MKITTKVSLLLLLMSISLAAESKGGFSSGGGGGRSGGFSSSGRSSSYSSARPSSYSSPSRQTASISRSTTVSRSYSSRVNYGGGHMYGGFGMGYGYSNGLLTGMIIANMMHPYGTMMYSGPGQYGNNALLYPDGRVVNQQGYLVGNYQNGQFTAIQNGGLIAQQIPQDAFQAQPQPVIIQDNTGAIVVGVLVGGLLLFLIVAMIII